LRNIINLYSHPYPLITTLNVINRKKVCVNVNR